MSRKARQIRFDRLLVANIGEHAAKHRRLAAGARRYQHPSLRHQREQPDSLARNGFAPSVRPGNHNSTLTGADSDVDWNHFAPAGHQQWMPRAGEIDSLVHHFRLDATESL